MRHVPVALTGASDNGPEPPAKGNSWESVTCPSINLLRISSHEIETCLRTAIGTATA